MRLIILATIKVMVLALCTVTISSCSDKIEVQHNYDYALQTMPVPSELALGESAEIRCTLIKQGNYEQNQFTLRYFQPEGKGELKMDDGTVFKPNDRYILNRDRFYLYYTSQSEEQQTIDIYIEDGWQVQKYTFEFNNVSVEEPQE